MNVQDLNAMAIAQLKEFYASLTNPVAIEGDKRRKESWISAIEKSMNAPKEQEIIPDCKTPWPPIYLPKKINIGSHTKPVDLDIIPNWLELPSDLSDNKYLQYHVDIAHPQFPKELLLVDINSKFVLKEYMSDTLLQFKHLTQFLYSIGFFNVDYFLNYSDTEKREDAPDDEIPFYEPYTEEELRELEEEQLEKWEQEYRALPKQEIFGVPISFGWTANRLLAGIKTVTRRTWNERYTSMFINAYKQGKLIQAFDKDRRYDGKLIGYLKISDIYRESLFNMPELDASAEGFPELSKREFIKTFFPGIDRYDNSLIWVIRFQFVPLPSQSEILERHKFRFFGNVNGCNFLDKHTEYKTEVNGWGIYLTPKIDIRTSGNVFFQRIDLINMQSGEHWTRNYYDHPNTRSSILVAKRAILEISYHLQNTQKLTHSKYESKTKRPETIK